jgi:protein ATS1
MRRPIVDIAAGVNHVVALALEGRLYGWGSSRHGQLGNALKPQETVWVPHRIDLPFKVDRVVAGRNFTFVVGTENQQLLLGESKSFPTSTESSPFISPDEISSGWSNIFSHGPRGLQAIGRNDRGQLPPQDLPLLKSFAAGSEHSIALTSENKVVSWGWGEHGNCGLPKDKKGNVANRYNIINVPHPFQQEADGVAAGCATSFILVGSALTSGFRGTQS